MRDPQIDADRKQFSAARLLKWQAEGLIIRLDDLADSEECYSRWTRLLETRRRANARFIRRNSTYHGSFANAERYEPDA